MTMFALTETARYEDGEVQTSTLGVSSNSQRLRDHASQVVKDEHGQTVVWAERTVIVSGSEFTEVFVLIEVNGDEFEYQVCPVRVF